MTSNRTKNNKTGSFFCILALVSSFCFGFTPFSPISEIEEGVERPTLVKDGGDADWELECPVGCDVALKKGPHREITSFCDCDGDGEKDEGCQILLKERFSGEQRTFCQQDCPEEEQCVKETKTFPSGQVQQSCECDTPLCDVEVRGKE